MKLASPPPLNGAQSADDKSIAAQGVSTDLIHSRELFGDRTRELVIEHAGFLYRLRITQNNKLILTK